MVHATYIITLCWLSANGTIFLYINSLGLRPRDFKYKSIVHLPNAINRVTIKTICKIEMCTNSAVFIANPRFNFILLIAIDSIEFIRLRVSDIER